MLTYYYRIRTVFPLLFGSMLFDIVFFISFLKFRETFDTIFFFLRPNWILSIINGKEYTQKKQSTSYRKKQSIAKRKASNIATKHRQTLTRSFSSRQVFNPIRYSWNPDLFLSSLFCKLCKIVGYFVALPTNMSESDSCLLEAWINLQTAFHNVANYTSYILILNSLNCLQWLGGCVLWYQNSVNIYIYI